MKRIWVLLPFFLTACQDAGTPVRPAAYPYAFALPITLEQQAPAAVEPGAAEPVTPQAPEATVPELVPSTPRPIDGPRSPGEFGGRVRGLDPSGEQPVGGARVTLSDGREAYTDAQGAFTFAGAPPADGAYAVTHRAYMSSAVLGLSGPDVALHLQPRLAVLPGSDAGSAVTWEVQGYVVGPDGPVDRATVVLRDARGGLGAPAFTDEHGDFTMRVHAQDGRVAGGSLLAKGMDGQGLLLGALNGIALTPSTTTLAPVTLVRAEHAVRFALDTHLAPGPMRYTVTAVGPGGARLSLASDGEPLAIAPLPAVRYMVDAVSRDDLGGAASEWHRDDLSPNFAGVETVLTGAMLEPPSFLQAPALAPGGLVRWGGAQGAVGFTLSVFGLEGQGPQWEGFTQESAMTVPAFGHAGPGRYRLTLTAMDGPDLDARHVASLGPSRLRLLPWPGGRDARRAVRWTVLSK